MVQKKVRITNRLGVHARPASLLVKTAVKFKSGITIIKDDMEVNGKSIMGVMMLAAEKGSILTIRANGPDQDKALEALVKVIESKFDED